MKTSPKQAAVRMHSGHLSVLERLERGEKPWPPQMRVGIGDARVLRTIEAWGAVAPGGRGLTEKGREILEAYRQRWPMSRPESQAVSP